MFFRIIGYWDVLKTSSWRLSTVRWLTLLIEKIIGKKWIFTIISSYNGGKNRIPITIWKVIENKSRVVFYLFFFLWLQQWNLISYFLWFKLCLKKNNHVTVISCTDRSWYSWSYTWHNFYGTCKNSFEVQAKFFLWCRMSNNKFPVTFQCVKTVTILTYSKKQLKT